MENREALISVIIPVYNGEKYLTSCVENIREQTYRNLEIIIINDGSSDGTGQVCERLQKMYDNVRIITLGDEGVSAARNAGIEAAKGEFITFVDADDRLKTDTLRILYDCILTTECDVAGCQFFVWKNEDDWKNIVVKNTEQPVSAAFRTYTPDLYIQEAVLKGNSRCWSKLYRKEALGKTRFRTELSIGEDMLFLMDMLASVRKIAEIPYQGYGYFQNPGGAIARGFTPKYMDQITCWELARDIIAGRNAERDLYEQATALLMVGIMLTVGKLSMMPGEERRKHEKYVCICHNKIKEVMSVTGAYKKLPAGYKVKTKLFYYMPHLYLWLYHIKGEIKR